jgi:hypothetical protein
MPLDPGLRALLLASQAAMVEAASRYRVAEGLAGNDPNVPGWVAGLEQQQRDISAAIAAADGS